VAGLLDELSRDVQEALDGATKLAQHIYPPLLDAGGLRAALRAAAETIGVPTRIAITASARYPPEIVGAVYFCCVEALAQAGAAATVTVRDEEAALTFEVVADRAPSEQELLRDRVEALGGRLKIRTERGGGTRVSGLLPLAR
jgi:signal transduction histidine kinase